MILPALVFLFKNSIIQKFLEIAGKHSYSDLKNNFDFYKILEELGIEKPKDEQERLYLHSTVLFAAKGKQEELVKLLLLKDSQDAFFKETRNNEEGAFLRELDHALHTKSFIKEIKNWQQVPDDDIQEFIGIYQDLINLVATPVQHAVLNETRSLSALMTDRHRENQENFQDIKKEMQELKVSLILPQSHVTEPLQQEYERQLTVILQTLNDGKVRQALNEFETLREQLWSQLELKLKFKLLTNLGVAYFKLNEQEKAAPLLIEAHKLDPESKVGWSNMVNAYLSLGDTENAERYISAFIHKFPDSISAYSAFIKLKAEDYTVDEIRAMVPVLIRDDVDITTALGLAARQREEFQLSIELLRTAKKSKPDDRYINQQLLQSWLEVLARNYKLINLRILTEEDKTNLVALLGIIHKEQELTDVHENPLAKANFYLAEGFVLFLLKRNIESAVANNKGLEIDPESVFLRKQQGMLFAFSGDLHGAINMLSGIKEYEYMPDVPLLLSEIYRNNGQYEEAVNLIEEKRNTITDKKFIAQSKFVLLDLYIRQKSDEKIAILEQELSTDTISDLISLARIAVYRNNKEDSKTNLKQAIKLAEENVNFRERFLLAEQLFKYEMYDEAIVQLEKISDPTVPSEINNYLGRAYRKAGRTADTLRLLSLIREHNGPMKGYTEEEINIYIHELSNYSSARDILEAYIATFDNEFGMELQLNEVNMRLELFDKVDAFFSKPIKIWELQHNLVRVYVTQLLKTNHKKRAVELTYEYRRIKNNEEAHVLFLQTLLQYPNAKEGTSEEIIVTSVKLNIK